MAAQPRIGVCTKLALPAGIMVLLVMALLLLAGTDDLARFTTSRRLQQLPPANASEADLDWEIVPSALDLDPRLQHLLDRHNMSSEETVMPDRPEVQEKGNPPSSLPGAQKFRHAAINQQTMCTAQLQFPKVAMLFLTRGQLYHAETWRHWFREAEGLIPYSALPAGACSNLTAAATATAASSPAPAAHRRALMDWPRWTGFGNKGLDRCWCESDHLQVMRFACLPDASPHPLQRQQLFNVYVHTQPNFTGFAQDSIFYGYEIADRVEVTWGTITMVDAARQLLREALQDPLNQKMMMLSESGIPLWPPQFVYQQLLAENRSRLDSCGLKYTDPSRWSARMSIPGGLRRHEFRKSSQWFALRRDHAQLALDEVPVYERFAKYCVPGWDKDYRRDRWCFSDEHYIPTLLATSQLGHETDCEGLLVSVDWRGINGPHPRSYRPEESDALLLDDLRHVEGCNDVQEVMRKSRDSFLDLRDAAPGASLCGASNKSPVPEYSLQVEPTCPLFARKFPLDTAKSVLRTVAGCDSPLGLTSPHSCLNPAELPSDQTPMQEVTQGTLDIKGVPKSLSAKLRLGWLQPQQPQQQQQQPQPQPQGQPQQQTQPMALLKALQQKKARG